jgi:hypothetical protein
VCRARVLNSRGVPRPIVEDLLLSFGESWDGASRRWLVAGRVVGRSAGKRLALCGGNRCAPNVCQSLSRAGLTSLTTVVKKGGFENVHCQFNDDFILLTVHSGVCGAKSV